jgi:hypothetical protein
VIHFETEAKLALTDGTTAILQSDKQAAFTLVCKASHGFPGPVACGMLAAIV